MVQPDITIVCDLEKLDKKGGIGAPDWIIEIASPSIRKKDMTVKREVYEFSGVNEYWMVDPEEKTVKIFSIGDNGKYVVTSSNQAYNTISPVLFPNLSIDLDDIFPEMNLMGEPWPEYDRL